MACTYCSIDKSSLYGFFLVKEGNVGDVLIHLTIVTLLDVVTVSTALLNKEFFWILCYNCYSNYYAYSSTLPKAKPRKWKQNTSPDCLRTVFLNVSNQNTVFVSN